MHRHALLLALSLISGAVVHTVQRVPLSMFTDLGLTPEQIGEGSQEENETGPARELSVVRSTLFLPPGGPRRAHAPLALAEN